MMMWRDEDVTSCSCCIMTMWHHIPVAPSSCGIMIMWNHDHAAIWSPGSLRSQKVTTVKLSWPEMGHRPKNIFYGGRGIARVRFNSRPIVATFPPIAIIEAALYAKTCHYLYLNAGRDRSWGQFYYASNRRNSQ